MPGLALPNRQSTTSNPVVEIRTGAVAGTCVRRIANYLEVQIRGQQWTAVSAEELER
jgi:hypothetical protein